MLSLEDYKRRTSLITDVMTLETNIIAGIPEITITERAKLINSM